MKRLISIFLTLCLLLGITACSAPQPSEEISSANGSNSELESDSTDSADSSADVEESTLTQPEGSAPQSNILIAYFTWAENTSVADPDSVDVDAITSASVLMPGNVEFVL